MAVRNETGQALHKNGLRLSTKQGAVQILRFLTGSIDNAKDMAKKAKEIMGSKDPIPHFSLGFLFAFEGDLDKAFKHYRYAFVAGREFSGDFIFHLIEFTQAVLRLHPARFQLHLTLALLYKEFTKDTVVILEEINLFLVAAVNARYPSKWIEYARSEIVNISASTGARSTSIANDS